MNKHKKHIILCLLLFSFYLFFSGIIRHDRQIKQHITYGQNVSFNCVGEIYHLGKFQQSVVLIDSNHILCTAHAFMFGSGPSRFDSLFIPEVNKWVYGNVSDTIALGNVKDFKVKIGRHTAKISSITVHENYLKAGTYRDKYGIHSGVGFQYDIAIATLCNPILDIRPAELHKEEVTIGKKGIFCGYGDVEKANEVEKNNRFRKRRKLGGENIIDSIEHFKEDTNYQVLRIDFDSPTDSKRNRFGSSEALELEYMPSGGDCGSGVFIQTQNGLRLAGLCAALDSPYEYFTYGIPFKEYYGYTASYLSLASFSDWIEKNR